MPEARIPYAQARANARAWVDSYRPVGKLHPAMCRHCHATEWQGEWHWDAPVPDLAPVTCPACERLRDGVPAHTVELTGDLPRHWNDVRRLLGEVERTVVAAWPLERLFPVRVLDDRVVVATTGMRIARHLVATLVRRYRHGVQLRFGEDATIVRWG
jgi:hypothetical protein